MSSPTRAVERQCTRRRSSPWRYSRVATSSSPRGRHRPRTALAAGRPAAAEPDRRAAGATAGTTVSVSTAVNDAGQLDQPERVGQPEPQRADRGSGRGRRSAPGRRPPGAAARLDPVEHEPRPGAERVRDLGPRAAAARSAGARRSPARSRTVAVWPGRRPAPGRCRGCRPAGTGSARRRRGRPAAARAGGSPTRSRSRSPSTQRAQGGGDAGGEEAAAARGQPADSADSRALARPMHRRPPAAVVGRHAAPRTSGSDQLGHDRVGAAPGDLGLGGQQQPVREHRDRPAAARRRAARSRGRPARPAAFAARSSCSVARGEAPSRRSGDVAGGGDQVDGVAAYGVGETCTSRTAVDQAADLGARRPPGSRSSSGSCRPWSVEHRRARRRRRGSPSRPGP